MLTCVAQDKHVPASNAVEVSNVKWVEMQQFYKHNTSNVYSCPSLFFVKCFVIA
jgi:isopentenyldiphosphate isomerase